MMPRLFQCAERKWRQKHGFDRLATVVDGIIIKNEVKVTDFGRVVGYIGSGMSIQARDPVPIAFDPL